jgi:hypothetical protein
VAPLAAACGTAKPRVTPAPAGGAGPSLSTDAAALQSKWDAAVGGLARNVQRVFGFDRPVLIEGGEYPGIWLECGPQEGLAYADFAPDVARDCHDIFFALQRQDGYLPCWILEKKSGAGQIQMVVPIAATALELAERRPDEAFLRRAYAACGRWDAWLRKHRDTRGTGLVEAFCGYDTGHDNSPRFEGLPWECPEGDARLCPRVGNLPYLAPDLSASAYGGRVALAKMAKLLGRGAEEAEWLERAEQLRKAIVKQCLDPVDVYFYDVDKNDRFVRIKTDALSRVLGEHVPDDKLFAELWRRHMREPAEFWTAYPFPSIAANDAQFDTKPRRNSWGGPSQALTALRAPRWMERYGKPAELVHVLGRWQAAIVAAGDFHQQLDPATGAMSTSKDYSPAMLVLLESVARLHGVRRIDPTQGLAAPAGALEWTCGLPAGASHVSYTLPTGAGVAELSQDATGARLVLAGRTLATIAGRARVRTDRDGKPLALVGVAAEAAGVTFTGSDGRARAFTLAPNQVQAL